MIKLIFITLVFSIFPFANASNLIIEVKAKTNKSVYKQSEKIHISGNVITNSKSRVYINRLDLKNLYSVSPKHMVVIAMRNDGCNLEYIALKDAKSYCYLNIKRNEKLLSSPIFSTKHYKNQKYHRAPKGITSSIPHQFKFILNNSYFKNEFREVGDYSISISYFVLESPNKEAKGSYRSNTIKFKIVP